MSENSTAIATTEVVDKLKLIEFINNHSFWDSDRLYVERVIELRDLAIFLGVKYDGNDILES